MTKKNVGGSFTFEAYNSKEYTDGISFSINQDGQYKVNHVLDNKWGKVAVLATKDDLNTWESITSDCTLANGISIGTFKVYKNTAQKLIKMNGYLTITSEQELSKTLLTFPSNIKLIGYQYVLAYNAYTGDNYGIYGTDANVLRNDTKTIPVMKYFAIPNVTMNFT